MWQLIRDLPLEIASMDIFAILSVKDIVQVERALVATQQRRLLFDMVRAGPSLRVYIAMSADKFYNWLRKNKLVRASCSFEEVIENGGDNAHEHVESLSLTVDEATVPHPGCSALYDKVTTLHMNRANLHFAPGNYLHKLQEFSTHAANCLDDWVLEVVRANPTIRTLELKIPDGELPPARWFSKLGRLCGNLHELHLSGLRSVVDDDVLWEVAEHCTALRTLDIAYFAEMGSMLAEGPMIAIAQQCQRLDRLRVIVVQMTTPVATAMCLHATNLTSLHVSAANLSFTDLQLLLPQHRKQPLIELECRWALQQESEVQACAALFSGLTTLAVTLPERCERAFTAAVPFLSAVHELWIACLGTDTGMIVPAVAERCTQLRVFTINEFSNISRPKVAPKAFINIIERNRYLRHADWGRVEMGAQDALLRALAQHCPLLEQVTCADVSDDAVHVLVAGCSHLRCIDIKNAGITDAALVSLSTYGRSLWHVEIESCHKVTEAGCAALAASCPSLFSLSIWRCGMDAAAAARIRSKRAKGRAIHVGVH